MIKVGLDQKRRDEGGFTIIELLIIIIIIGILAGIVIFAVGGMRQNTHDEACRADLRTLKTANELYNTGFGFYATSETTLTSVGLLDGESSLYDLGGTPADPTYPLQGSTCT